MKLDRNLNFVVPVDTDAGTAVYVHATPISRAVFEEHYLVISKTFAAIHQQGLAALSGPRVAALLLRDVAKRTAGLEVGENAWDGPTGVERTLLPEIRRLTNVIVPTDDGYRTLPYQEVVDKKQHMSADDVAEVEGILAFFTVASAMHRRSQLQIILSGAASLWAAQVTSLNCTEYAASLQTASETDSSGETAAS